MPVSFSIVVHNTCITIYLTMRVFVTHVYICFAKRTLFFTVLVCCRKFNASKSNYVITYDLFKILSQLHCLKEIDDVHRFVC